MVLRKKEEKGLHTSQKLLKAQRDIPIPIIIIFFKHVRHSLKANTALHKQIEAHAVIASFIVGSKHQPNKRRRQAIPECNEGFAVLVIRDVSAAVFVEAVEESTPSGKEAP